MNKKLDQRDAQRARRAAAAEDESKTAEKKRLAAEKKVHEMNEKIQADAAAAAGTLVDPASAVAPNTIPTADGGTSAVQAEVFTGDYTESKTPSVGKQQLVETVKRIDDVKQKDLKPDFYTPSKADKEAAKTAEQQVIDEEQARIDAAIEAANALNEPSEEEKAEQEAAEAAEQAAKDKEAAEKLAAEQAEADAVAKAEAEKAAAKKAPAKKAPVKKTTKAEVVADDSDAKG